MPTIMVDIPDDIAETFHDVEGLRQTLYEDEESYHHFTQAMKQAHT